MDSTLVGIIVGVLLWVGIALQNFPEQSIMEKDCMISLVVSVIPFIISGGIVGYFWPA